MGEKKRKQAAKESPGAPPKLDARTTPIAPSIEPAFFFGFEIPRAKLAFARFWIFGLLAVDAFLQLRHAPRYGAGGFNVGQLPGINVGPSRIGVGIAYIMLAYLFGSIALGVGSRITVALSALIYAWLYFSSQLDSYQHHYLMVLVLALSAAVPWFADGSDRARSWALRVILIQLGILYLWAAIAKMDASWLDGSALRAALDAGGVRRMVNAIGFESASWLVILVEMNLALMIWIPRMWWIAFPLGVAMHVGIAFTNLEIGLFSWLMVALYLLVIPDRLFVALAEPFAPVARLARRLAGKPDHPAVNHTTIAVALALPIALSVEIPHALLAALIAIPIIIVADALRRRRLRPRPGAALASVAVTVLLAILAAKTKVVPDYYRLWGGAMRRLGNVIDAQNAYRRATEVDPDSDWNYLQLGKLLLADGIGHDEAAGLAALHRAEALAPQSARAFMEEARYLEHAGRHDDAIAAATAGVSADLSDDSAAALLAALRGGQAPTPEDAQP